MSQPNQNDNPGPGDSRHVSLKRKRTTRGRARKYLKPGEEGYTSIILNPEPNQNQGGVNDALVPPGFENVSGNQPCQENNSDSVKPGQVFPVIIEGEFDGGYLISVKIGNSNPSLKGLVFKPKSDVANANLFPAALSQVQNPIPNTMNEEQNVMNNTKETVRRNESCSVIEMPKGAVSSGNPGAYSSEKNVPPVADQTIDVLLTRGRMVPVEFKPANLSTVVAPSYQVMNQASLENRRSISQNIPHALNRPSPGALMSPPTPSQGSRADSSGNQKTSQNILSKQSENHQSSSRPSKMTSSMQDKKNGEPGWQSKGAEN